MDLVDIEHTILEHGASGWKEAALHAEFVEDRKYVIEVIRIAIIKGQQRRPGREPVSAVGQRIEYRLHRHNLIMAGQIGELTAESVDRKTLDRRVP